MDDDAFRGSLAFARLATIDVAESTECHGFLRTLSVTDDNTVIVEFMTRDEWADGAQDCSGPKYSAKYEDYAAMVTAIEAFLGRSRAGWRLLTHDEPAADGSVHSSTSLSTLEDAVRSGAIRLPTGAAYSLQTPYFRHILKYGSFRDDKVFEEQDEHLGLFFSGPEANEE